MRKMKDSGIEWIGKIPEDWEVCKLKYLATVQTGNTPSMNNENLFFSREKGIPWIKAENLNTDMSIEKTEQYLTPEGVNEGRVFPKNTVYICCIASIGKVGFSCIEASCNQQINALSFNDKFYWKYGFYLSKAQEEEYLLLASGNVVKILNSERQKNMFCPFPPLVEQQKIVDFLDKKCSEIDSVISKTRETIEEYKKLKQSIITEVVTGKVKIENGKVCGKYDTYKDSGIEWIGEIPSEWSVIRTKFISDSMSKGNGITKEQIVQNGDSPCVRYGEIYSKYNHSFSNCITKTNKSMYTNLQYFSYGDILFACTGELPEEIGKNIVYLGNEDCLAGGDIIVMKHSQNPSFLNYVYNSYGQIQKSLGKTKLKVVHISATEIANIFVVLPSLPVQQQISDFLDKNCSEIDKLITKKEQLVVELEAYKKSLIYEVVTGKREV